MEPVVFEGSADALFKDAWIGVFDGPQTRKLYERRSPTLSIIPRRKLQHAEVPEDTACVHVTLRIGKSTHHMPKHIQRSWIFLSGCIGD